MPAENAQHHQHPGDPRQFVFGRRLTEGDVIEARDVYDSSNRTWERATCAGLTFQGGNAVIWVRPEPCPPERELVPQGNLLVERRSIPSEAASQTDSTETI